jgi:acetyl-CoA carboxylase biotin carboxyl carrier protein
MIDIKKLKQLIELMAEHELTELDIRDEKETVTLKRGSGGTIQFVPAPQAAAPSSPAAASAAPAEDAGLVKIASPMVGSFYSAPSPDAEPFVKVGSKIGPDTVVCIIEAMKVFNEIKAEVSGTVEKVLVASGQAVEFGQPLFLIRPQ